MYYKQSLRFSPDGNRGAGLELRIMPHKKSGQIVVFVLLLSLMGLTIGLSQISRSLSDLKQVTYVDAGTKAFAGAEAGLQLALSTLTSQEITSCTGDTIVTNLLALTQNFSSVTYNICPNLDPYAYFPDVMSDEAREINLANIVNTTSIDVAWHNETNPNTGLEIIITDTNNALTRYAYNAFNSPLQTGFRSSYSASNCTSLINSAGSCTSQDISGTQAVTVSSAYKLLRVKPLAGSNGTTDIVVLPHGGVSPTPSLGPTTYTITATAVTTNQTKKKLQIIKTPAALPGVFDNAFYSGGSITKN